MTPDLSDIRTYRGIISDRKIRGVSVPTGERLEVQADVVYSAVGVDTLDTVAVTDVVPQQRSARGPRVITAQRGDPCEIMVQRGQAPKLYVREPIAFREACTPA